MPARSSSSKRRAGGGLGKVGSIKGRLTKGRAQWLKLDDGDEYVLRMGGTEGKFFQDAFVHRVPITRDDGTTYYADVPCLDQKGKGIACPGCKDDLDLRYKFWANVVVRDFEDEDSGEEKDTLMIWSGGSTISKRLDKMLKRRALEEQDIIVEREGKKMQDTKYEVDWDDDSETGPLSDGDKKLFEDAFDLTRYSKPPSFEDFYKAPGDRNKDDADDAGEKSLRRGSSFKSRRKKEDDDDDEPKRRTSSRRSSSSSSKSGLGSIKKKGDSTSSDKTKNTTVRRRRSR